jgi:endonuclease I/V8-like Glu-specific endopeptidase
MITDSFLAEVRATTQRYEDRTPEREENKRVLEEEGVLHADPPDLVEKRLDRLGVDWGLARAVERTGRDASTGRSLDEELAPDGFGADVLALERMMGHNDLVDVGFLERGYLAGRAVGRISVGAPDAHYGTGFLISPRLLMTNNHVLADPAEAARGYVEMNFQAGLDGRALQPVAFALEPDAFFTTDRPLDFTIVAVAERSDSGAELADFGWLRLIEQPGKVLLGELLNIIQHPNAEPKQLALRENRLTDRLPLMLHYETDTAPGSSGSPVFNDQWEVVALHHSGVPETDKDGNWLSTDGTIWTPDMGEERVHWVANEGVRVSGVLRALREQQLTGPAAELRAQVSEAAPPPTTRFSPAGQAAPSGNAGETASWTLPLTVSVTLGGVGEAARPSGARPVPGTPAGPAPAPRPAPAEDPELRAALLDAEVARGRPYYPKAADDDARARYYEAVDDGAGGEALYRALSELVDRSHEPRPAYKPMRLVYPWVDVHPDGKLRSIYSGKTFSPEELIRADAGVEQARTERLQELVQREAALGPGKFEAEFDALEAALPYNCEHVVPQSWFGKHEPMRGDLHHLFTCESGCNSFRGNFPYIDFPDADEALREACGHREANGFEPAAGKGPVARATLYFLLCYPRLVGDTAQELRAERLEMLLTWHRSDAVNDYERHRNFAIAELQGNRNPLIDHPEWADSIDFSAAWA